MISNFDIHKALRDHLKANTALTVVGLGDEFQPSPTQDYLTETVILGDESSVGINPTSSDEVSGTLQIGVCTPIDNGKFANLALCDTVKGYFPKFQFVGVCEIGSTSKSQPLPNDTHIVTYLRVGFQVVN